MSEPKIAKRNSAEPKISSYLHAKGAAMGIPVSGNFELTSRCNFNCKMCYIHSIENQKELMHRELCADQWLGIASDARDAGTIFLLLTGGEPFLRKDFTRIYEELIKMGMVISINTNASLYNEEIRDCFLKNPPARINVSLYGGSEETYQSLCGNASYEKVTKAIQQMKADAMQVRLNVTLTPYNICDMAKIDQFSKENNLHVKATTYMYPPVRANGNIGSNPGRFDAEEAGKMMAAWDRLRETDAQFQMRVKKMCSVRPAELSETSGAVKQEGVSCRAGKSSFWVTWEGNMLPCGMLDLPPVNILEHGFTNAWEKVRETTRQILLPAECASCSMRSNCSICAAISRTETGAFDKRPEYVCQFTRFRFEETARLAGWENNNL